MPYSARDRLARRRDQKRRYDVGFYGCYNQNARNRSVCDHFACNGVCVARLRRACRRILCQASAGFAKNLRKDLYYKVQEFSFENVDKFSTSSLVTRMTTDVTNVQFSYMMIVRMAFRCPVMLIFSVVMAFIMADRLPGYSSRSFRR